MKSDDEEAPRKRRRRRRKLTASAAFAMMRAANGAPAGWPTCPGCGTPFKPRREGKQVSLIASTLYERWSGKPCCSVSCKILVQLLGPIDQALSDPYQALNTNLGRLLLSIVGRMRRNAYDAQVELSGVGRKAAEFITAPELDESRRRMLRARSRQLLTISRALYDRRGRFESWRETRKKPGSAGEEPVRPAGERSAGSAGSTRSTPDINEEAPFDEGNEGNGLTE